MTLCLDLIESIVDEVNVSEKKKKYILSLISYDFYYIYKRKAFLNYKNVLLRLSKLINIKGKIKNITLLQYITNHCVIAGGSVVYGLCDFVPIKSVGDIDVYVLNENKDMFFKMVDTIRNIYSQYKITYAKRGSCVVEARINDETNVESRPIVFQIILTGYTCEQKLIEEFDIDYVQCGIYRQRLLITECAKQAHKTRRITMYSKDIRASRVVKASDKGFIKPHGVYSGYSHTPEGEQVLYKDLRHINLIPLYVSNYDAQTHKCRPIVKASTIVVWYTYNVNLKKYKGDYRDQYSNHGDITAIPCHDYSSFIKPTDYRDCMCMTTHVRILTKTIMFDHVYLTVECKDHWLKDIDQFLFTSATLKIRFGLYYDDKIEEGELYEADICPRFWRNEISKKINVMFTGHDIRKISTMIIDTESKIRMVKRIEESYLKSSLNEKHNKVLTILNSLEK